MISPHRTPTREYPDSPDYNEKYSANSDDLRPTSLHITPSSYNRQRTQHLVIVGSHNKPITLGRGGASTVKIGRRNRQISRVHISIEYNTSSNQFELTVLGLNGAIVDDIQYNQHAIVPLENNSYIDVLGDHVIFRVPPPPLNFNKCMMDTVIVDKKDIFTTIESPKEIEFTNENTLNEHSENTIEEHNENTMNTLKEHSDNTLNEHSENTLDTLNTTQDINTDNTLKGNIISTETTHSPVDMTEEREAFITEEPLSPEIKPCLSIHSDVEDMVEDITKEEVTIKEEDIKTDEKDTTDYSEVIIDALVFSRASSMPISDICSRILKANPVYAEQPRSLWIERIRSVLKEKPFFGEIQRKGKTADGSPKENLYYYNSELDPVEWRRTTYTQVGRSARKCTLKDKQYFWKIPPKLGRHRNYYIPPPAPKDTKRQREEEEENIQPKLPRC